MRQFRARGMNASESEKAVDLYCETLGSGPDLVILHPAGLDHTFMKALMDDASSSHRVLGVDLRGHGLSPAAHNGITLDAYVADVYAAINRHCAGPAVVLGLSLGGMVAQLLALHYPEVVSGLVLCGCTGGFPSEVRPLLHERGLAALRDGMAAVVEPTIERWFTHSFLTDSAVDGVRGRLLRNDASNWSATWHAIATFDALPRLGEVRVPTLVIAGERDVATSLVATAEISETIHGARRVILPGAPHMMQIECRDAFNSAVGTFLAGLRIEVGTDKLGPTAWIY